MEIIFFFFFEDRTSVFFLFSIRHFWHKVRGKRSLDKAVRLTSALNRRKIKEEQFH